jgi:RNA polymerase sigma-70 factor (ECF subfamily)
MKFKALLVLAIVWLGSNLSLKEYGYSASLVVHIGGDFCLEAMWDRPSEDWGQTGMKDRTQEDRFEAILVEYDAALRRLASAYEKNTDLRNDLIQEIRLALWRALPAFRGQSSERTFIYRIAHNRALTHIAKRHPEQLDMSIALELRDVSPDPEQIVVLRWQRAELQTRIALLPLTLRQVVTLALEGLSNTDISQVLGITEGNVAVRLTRAKKQLKSGGANYE